MEQLIDFYSLGLTSTISSYNGFAFGETFIVNLETKLTKTSRYLYGNGTRTGNLAAKVYTLSGTYGVDSIPDTLLATSDTIVANTINFSIPGPYTEFTFSGANQITLTPGYYYMTIESSTGDYGFNTATPTSTAGSVGDSAYYDAGAWHRDTPGFSFGIYGIYTYTSSPYIIQAYNEGHVNNALPIAGNIGDSNLLIEAGESFIPTFSSILESCKFYLNKNNSPTGNAVAKLFSSIAGVKNALLATSGTVNVSTISASPQLVSFTFSGVNRVPLYKDTTYVVGVYYDNGIIESLDFIAIGLDSNPLTYSGVTYAMYGNGDISSGSSSAISFYVYGSNIKGPLPSHLP